jgi:hypothetical protein
MRRATGDIRTDSIIPEVIEAEERAIRFLRGEYGARAVEDTRKLKRGYDFIVKDGMRPRKGDVKADFHALETKRLAWESVIRQPNGTKKPGWGQYAIDIIAVVAVDTDGQKAWRMYICQAKRWREYADRAVGEPGWVRFTMENKNGTAGCGWAIPIAELKAAGVILREDFI